MRHRALRDNVRPELRPVFDLHAKALFENMDEDVCQNGKQKLEGVYRGGYFRSTKVYRLLDSIGAGDDILRCKGTPRSVIRALEPRHFDVRCKDESEMVAAWALRAQPTLDMGLSVQTRRLPIRINFKRHVIVRKLCPLRSFYLY